MSNRQARREQSRQARRQATSYQSGRSRGSSQGGGGDAGGGGGGGGRGSNFLSWPYLIGVSLLAAGLLAVVLVLAFRDDGDDSGDPGEESLSVIDQSLADLPVEMQNGNKLGSDDAPVKIIQFEDFQCPHCLTYTLNNEHFLIEEFVKAGLLQIEFKHLPVVGPESVTAAVGASCAGEQNRMFEYANRLFAKQAEDNFRPDQGVFSEEKLVELAGEMGLDAEAFAACQVRPDALSPVATDQASAQGWGFRGTPNFVINETPLQNPPQSNERWREIIEAAIEAATPEDEAEGDAEADGEAEDESDAGDDDTP